MVWTDPITWTGGQLVTETQLNTYIRDNMNYLLAIVGSANQNAGGTYIYLDPADAIPSISGVVNAPITQTETGTSVNDYVGGFVDNTIYCLQWKGRWPTTAGTSVPHAKGNFFMAAATSGTVVFGIQVAARSPGDSRAGKSFATTNLGTISCPGTAGVIATFDIALTNNDSIAAGDSVNFLLYRNTDDPKDNASGIAYYLDGEVK
jgi:hypothetical protein